MLIKSYEHKEGGSKRDRTWTNELECVDMIPIAVQTKAMVKTLSATAVSSLLPVRKEINRRAVSKRNHRSGMESAAHLVI